MVNTVSDGSRFFFSKVHGRPCTCQRVSIWSLYLEKSKSWPLNLADSIDVVIGSLTIRIWMT
jgi:hypothetical protein